MTHHWLRATPTVDAAPAADVVRCVAVSAEGRRDPRHDVATAITALPPGAAIILAHAGAATGRWSLERPSSLGGDVTDPVTGRRARGLDEAASDAVIADFARAADHVRRLGGRPIVAAVDDDLLHGALSPLGGGGHGGDVVLAILRACAPCDVLLTVEDLAPGGLTPTQGVAFAREAVAAARASRLFAAGGSGWLEPLRRRRKGRSVDRSGLGLASAAWCVGVVPVAIWGVVRGEVDRDVVVERARRAGLAGVLHLDDTNDALNGAATDVAQPGRP